VLGGLTLFAEQRLVTAEQWAHTATTITYVRVLGELMLFARQRLVSARAAAVSILIKVIAVTPLDIYGVLHNEDEFAPSR
jgi:uncharacterized membrane protein